MNIQIPYKFTPRQYQLGLFEAMDSGYKRAIAVYHRRAGKDKSLLNIAIKKALERVGVYYYFFPEFAQGRRVIWDGIDGDGFRFLDHFPKQLIEGVPNKQEMQIRLINGSIIQIVGTDKYDKVRGSNPVGCVFSEYAFQNPGAWDVVRPILAENGGWAVFNSTPAGKNHFYKLYEMAKENPEWYTQLVTVEDSVDPITGQRYVSEAAVQAEVDAGMSDEMVRQEFYCFPKGSADVICQGEVKDISEIEIGDFVLTHSNRFRKVTGIINHQYEGELVRIKTIGNNKDIICTPNHPIRVCNDGVNHIWKSAGEITEEDRLLLPRLPLGKSSYISQDLATIIAWYITEGSTSKGAVQFVLNIDELKEAEGLSTALYREFGLKASIYFNVPGNSLSLVVCSVDLIEFLTEHCGSGSTNKKIPLSLIKGHEEHVYSALQQGDGCISNKQNVYATTSKTLAYQMQLLSNMIGRRARIRYVERPRKTIILGREVNQNDSYLVTDAINSKSTNIEKHKYDYSVKISSITKEPYSGLVYNLEVQHDHSYTVNSRVVHNCDFNVNVNGYYYLDYLVEAEEEGRIGHVPYDVGVPVDTWWDIGVGDSTAIWFTQTVGKEVHVIDFYQNNSVGLEHYAKELQSKKYVYNSHNFPHDMEHTEFGTGRTRLEMAEDLFRGTRINVIPKLPIEDGINAVRMMLPKCHFNQEKCAKGLDALYNYHREYDDKLKEFKNKPVHDWASHPSDAFRYFALGFTQPRGKKSAYDVRMSRFKTLQSRGWMTA